MPPAPPPRLLYLEPYLNHSHRALAQGLREHLPGRWTLLSLPGRHFRWRMRGAAACLALEHRPVLEQPWQGLICSSMLNLAELRGLVPALAQVPALVYFHENQLDYPAPGRADARQRRRDLFLAFSNLTSVLAARLALFNSRFQRDRFLAAGRRLLADLPDAVPPGFMDQVERRCRVLPVPIETAPARGLIRWPRRGPLRLVWNHRWEQDKDPQVLFAALFELAEQGLEFQVAVLGPRPARVAACFQEAPRRLGRRLVHLGTVERTRSYWRWLFWGDVVVSTARQENQGLAVAEAVWAGCRPLLPRAQVYPHLYPERFLYPPGELAPTLARLCRRPQSARAQDYRPLVQGMTWAALEAPWREIMAELVS